MIRNELLALAAATTLSLGCSGNLMETPPRGIEGDPLPVEEDDGVAPRVTLFEPEPGSFLNGDTLRIAGRVEDDSSVTLVIDGEDVPLSPDGSFDVTRTVAPGAYRVRAVATDAAGRRGSAFSSAMVGDRAAPGEMVPDAVALGMDAATLDLVAQAAADHLVTQDLGAGLVGRVASDWWGKLDVTYVAWSNVTASLGPGEGTIHATVGIHDVAVGLKFDPPVLPSTHGTLRVETLQVDAVLSVGASGGRPVVSVLDSWVGVHGFSYDIDGVPGAVEQLAEGKVKGMVQDQLESAVDTMLPRFVQDALAGLPMEGEIEVLDAPLWVGGAISELVVEPAGVYAAVDLGVEALEPLAGRESVGFLYVDGARPARRDAPLTIDVALDTVNAATFAAWSAGLLERALADSMGSAPVPAGLVGFLAPSLGRRVPAGAALEITTRVELPPVVLPRGDGLEVSVADVRMGFSAGGEVLLVLSVGLSTTITARVDEITGAVEPEIGEIRVRADAITAPDDVVAPERLDTAIEGLVRDRMAGLLDVGGLEVPSVLGLRLVGEQVAVRDGYLSFDGRVVPAE